MGLGFRFYRAMSRLCLEGESAYWEQWGEEDRLARRI